MYICIYIYKYICIYVYCTYIIIHIHICMTSPRRCHLHHKMCLSTWSHADISPVCRGATSLFSIIISAQHLKRHDFAQLFC